MCRRSSCKRCGKTTWAGCGQHVDQVMADVSPADRCPGHSKATASEDRRDATSAGTGTSRLARLFGRS